MALLPSGRPLWPASALVRWARDLNTRTGSAGMLNEPDDPARLEWDAVPFPTNGPAVLSRLRSVVAGCSLFRSLGCRQGGGGAASGPQVFVRLDNRLDDPDSIVLPLLGDEDVAKAVQLWTSAPSPFGIIYIDVRKEVAIGSRGPRAALPLAVSSLPVDMWACILKAVKCSRDAAALACVCSNAKQAHTESAWPRAVRVKRDGTRMEPASGVFFAAVSPGVGEDVQTAVDRCPRGGCVLLLPGVHAGPLMLAADKVVHVFGRGQATLSCSAGHVVTSFAEESSINGLILRREADVAPVIDVDAVDEAPEPPVASDDHTVWIRGGQLRMQACDVTNVLYACVSIETKADPVLVACKIHDAGKSGLLFYDVGTKGRVVDCIIMNIKQAGIEIFEGADPVITGCKVHNCAEGVYINGLRSKGRLEKCDVYSNATNVQLLHGADPTLVDCEIHLADTYGLHVSGADTTGRFEGCVLSGNGTCGLFVDELGDPTLVGCTLSDHFTNALYVTATARGKCRLGARNTFARNGKNVSRA